MSRSLGILILIILQGLFISTAFGKSLTFCQVLLMSVPLSCGVTGCVATATQTDPMAVIREAQEVGPRSFALLDSKLEDLGLNDNQGVEIIHLPQIHGFHASQIDQNLNDAVERHGYQMVDQILRSQFKVLQFLQLNPDSPIFVEGFGVGIIKSESFNFSDGSVAKYDLEQLKQMDDEASANGFQGNLTERLKKAFETGVPNSFEQLTDEQKFFLYRVNASVAAYLLGIVPRLYPAENLTTRIAMDLWNSSIRQRLENNEATAYLALAKDPIYQTLIHAGRETDAIINVLLFNKQTGNKKPVLLIFGGGHNFKDYTRGPLKISRSSG